MDRWVAKKSELQTKIAGEKVRALKMETREQVLRHLQTALKRTPKQLISYFIEKIILFNDHIDIYCKSIKIDNPDGNDSHREFSFYEVKMSVEVDRHTFGGEKKKQTYGTHKTYTYTSALRWAGIDTTVPVSAMEMKSQDVLF